ncbi:MAG: hypothetical protein ACOCVU_07515, partial [Desulfohalobiaceae bacterium]
KSRAEILENQRILLNTSKNPNKSSKAAPQAPFPAISSLSSTHPCSAGRVIRVLLSCQPVAFLALAPKRSKE